MTLLPTPLRRSRVVELLGETAARHSVHLLGIVTSTSDLVLDRGRTPGGDGLVVVAEGQTKGRGRRGTAWSSPPRRGVLFSMLVKPAPPPDALPLLSIVVGVAVLRVLRGLGLEARLKWPNDLLVGDGKVAGCLVDLAADAEGTPFAVIGIGINADHGRDDLPADASPRAASLRQLLGTRIDREALLASTIAALDRGIEALRSGDAADFLAEARRFDALLGRRVTVREGTTIHEGRVLETDPLRGLRLLTDDGHEILVRAEHAHILRIGDAPG